MTIDAHTHVHEPGMGNPRRAAAPDDLLREMDEAGVDAAVVIPLPGTASNDYVFRECARRPDRLAALYTPEFDPPSEAAAKFRRFAERHPVRGIKIHPRVQKVSVRDGAVHEVVGVAAELGATVLFDNFPYGDELDDPDLMPLAYHRLARAFPRATFVLAHAGGHKVMDAFLVAKSNPNVCLEISFTLGYFPGTSVERDLAFAAGRLPPGRVLYGSDFPSFGIKEYLGFTSRLLGELPEPNRTALFHGAAARLYRMGATRADR